MAQSSEQQGSTPTGSNGSADSSNGRSGAIRFALHPLSTELLSRANFANQTGMSFADPTSGLFRRDVYTALGYPKTITLKQYAGRYARGGVAKRIIDAYPNATWGGGGEIVEDPDPKKETDFEKQVADLFERLDAWQILRRADILAGLGHYSIVLIGTDSGELSEPLPESLNGQEAVLYLTPRGEEKAQIEKFDDDPTSERFGKPEVYQVNLGSVTGATGRVTDAANTSGAAAGTVRVHWSRILHMVEGNLEDEVFGIPRLKAVWNYLEDLDKNVGGGSEAAWKRMDPGMQLDVPFLGPNGVPLEVPEGVMNDLEDEVEEFQHGMRRFIRTRGVNLNQFQSDATMFGGNVDTILKLISATTAIPFRILTGSERGQLASTQDDDNWNDRITERRSGFANPATRRFVDGLIERKALPDPPKGYSVIWPEADELDEKQKAEVANTLANANKNQATAGDGLIITSDEMRDVLYSLEPMGDVAPELQDQQRAEEEAVNDAIVAAQANDVNEEALEPEWKAVHRAADANVGGFTTGVLNFWDVVGENIDDDALTAALIGQNIDGTQQLVVDSFEQVAGQFGDDLFIGILQSLVDGANNAAKVANRRDGWTAAQFNISFDQTNPNAIAWAETRAANLVAETSPETILGIRQLIVDGFEQGIPPIELSRIIRDRVGLLTRQVTSVDNLIADLRAAEPGDLITRFPPRPGVRRSPGFRVRIPKDGLTEVELQRRTAQYSSMQLNLRARTIARSETLRAANEGQKQLWQQAQRDGQLSNEATRVWITTPDSRLRPEHAEREGVEVGVNEEWPWGTEPGEEVLCRCAQGISSAGTSRAGLR